MKRTTRVLGVLGLLLGASLAGCGSDSPDASSSSQGGTALEMRLQADTGVTWLVDRDEAGFAKLLTALSPPPPLSVAVPRAQAAVAFLQRYADLLGARDLGAELVLVEDREDRLVPGAHHLRFAQRIPGSDVRVLGTDTFVHLDPSNAVRFVAVGFVKDLQAIAPQPAITEAEARDLALATVRARDPMAEITRSSRPSALVVRRDADGSGKLAWHVFARARVHGVIEAPEALVDAVDGRVLVASDGAMDASHTGDSANFYAYHAACGQPVPARTSTITYDDLDVNGAPTVNRLLRARTALQTSIVTDQFLITDATSGVSSRAPILAADPRAFDFLPGTQGAGAGVSTHANLALTDTFFRSIGQLGWDGTGALPITAAVHAWEPVPAGTAATTGFGFRGRTAYADEVLYFGDGVSPIGPTVASPSCAAFPDGVALDIVAHEFTHGVAQHRAYFLPTGESGALQEAIADVLGAAAENAVSPGDANFVMGEQARFITGGVRNLRSPRAMAAKFPGEQVPRAYSERLSTTAMDKDHGHIHDNSLIASHAFFLMTVGGTNEVSQIAIRKKQALGWNLATFFWHAALLAVDARSASSFHDFARVQMGLAQTGSLLFPGAPVAIACAWRAAEVFTDAELVTYGVMCDVAPPPGSSGGTAAADACAGHGDDLVCDPAEPSSALVCKGGVRIDEAVCADPGQRCKAASAADPTASVGGDGALVCE